MRNYLIRRLLPILIVVGSLGLWATAAAQELPPVGADVTQATDPNCPARQSQAPGPIPEFLSPEAIDVLDAIWVAECAGRTKDAMWSNPRPGRYHGWNYKALGSEYVRLMVRDAMDKPRAEAQQRMNAAALELALSINRAAAAAEATRAAQEAELRWLRFEASRPVFPPPIYFPQQRPITVPFYPIARTPTYVPPPTYLGRLGGNRYMPDSTANPYGPHGNLYAPNSLKNPYGTFGSPYSPNSLANPYATNAPRLFGQDGRYLGTLSTNQYDPDSVSNPYGRFGSRFSPDSISNPFGQYGSPFSPLSPSNPFTSTPPLILER